MACHTPTPRLLLALCPLLWLTSSLCAQRTRDYSGPHRINGDTAQLRYTYYLRGSDTLAQGPIELRLTRLEKDRIATWHWQGQYERNRLSGGWDVRAEHLTPIAQIGTLERNVLFSADGWEWVLSASFRSGLPQGEWLLLRRHVAASQASDTLALSRMALSSGKFEGPVRLENRAEGIKAEGQFSAGGLLSGLWRFESQEGSDTLTEWLRFEHGALDELWLVSGTDTVLHQQFRFPNDPTTRQTIAFDSVAQRAIRYRIALRQPLSPTLSAVLERHHSFLQSGLSLPFLDPELGSLWAALPGEGFAQPQGLIVLTEYPLGENEAATLDTLRNLTNELVARTDSLLKNPQYKLNRFGSLGLGLRYEALREIRGNAHRINTLLNDLGDPAMRFVDRELLLEKRLSTFRYPGELLVQTGDSLHTEPYRFPVLKFHESPLVALGDHLRDCLTQTDQIREESKELLEALKVEQYILAAETRMVELHDSVVALFEGQSAPESHSSFHAQLNVPVQRFLAEELARYHNLEAQDKFEQADRLIACLSQLTSLYDTLALLPIQLDRMDKAYTRQAYNPYTYTHLDERVKERIYAAYRQKLVPYLLEQTGRSLDCASIERLASNFGLLDRQMLAWLGEDTRKIERKLRRSDDPERLLKKLNLELRF